MTMTLHFYEPEQARRIAAQFTAGIPYGLNHKTSVGSPVMGSAIETLELVFPPPNS